MTIDSQSLDEFLQLCGQRAAELREIRFKELPAEGSRLGELCEKASYLLQKVEFIIARVKEGVEE